MRYAKIKNNDVANSPGIAVSFYTQGCPHHCPGCFNPETWDFNGGFEFTYDTLEEIISAMTENGIRRSLCVLGGEPLCEQNLFLTYLVVSSVKERLPQTEVYIWTGYRYEELIKSNSSKINGILDKTDFLIDGPFVETKKDLTLKMRGSSNQRIIDVQRTLKEGKIIQRDEI